MEGAGAHDFQCKRKNRRAVALSRDRGENFSPVPLELTDAVAELLEAPDGTVLAFGESGVVAIDVWRALPPPPPSAP